MYFVAIHLFYKSCCICLIGNLCVLLSHNEHWHERKQPQASRFTFCHIARFRSSCSFCSNYVSSLTGFPFTLSSSVSIFLLPYNPSILKDFFPCIVSLIKCTFFYYFFCLFIFISERYVHPLSDLDRK